jgi:phosphate transport system substrate-binding protein
MSYTASKARFFISLIILLTAMLVACNSPVATPTPVAVPQTSLNLAGSGGAATIVKYLANAYNGKHTDLAFNFLAGSGSSGGIKGALDGQLDLGLISRKLKDTETAAGLKYLEVGVSRIAIALSSDLSITALTGQQVKDIFLGKIRNWSEVGGPDVPITVMARDEEDSLTQTLRQSLFGKDAFSPAAVILTSEGDMTNALLKGTHSIGYLDYGNVRVSDLSVHVLTMDNLNPADSGNSYPYSRVVGVAYLPANAAKFQSFLDYLVSPEAQTLLADKGIIPAK